MRFVHAVVVLRNEALFMKSIARSERAVEPNEGALS
jgi:hypothetical protein